MSSYTPPSSPYPCWRWALARHLAGPRCWTIRTRFSRCARGSRRPRCALPAQTSPKHAAVTANWALRSCCGRCKWPPDASGGGGKGWRNVVGEGKGIRQKRALTHVNEQYDFAILGAGFEGSMLGIILASNQDPVGRPTWRLRKKA